MFFYHNSESSARAFSAIRKSFQVTDDTSFGGVLTERDIEKAFEDAECEFGRRADAVFTPAVTLWAFLSQMLFTGAARSCDAAVVRIQQMLGALGQNACSGLSGAYCKARAKIAEAVPVSLIRSTGEKAERLGKDAWMWNGRRHVFLVDGAVVSGPDTAENQAEYPQASRQAEGCGFPLMRVLVLVSLITGMVRNVAVSPYSGKGCSENGMFRKVLPSIPAGSVVVGDQYYGSYFGIAAMLLQKADIVTRLTTRRVEALGDPDQCETRENGETFMTWKRPVRPAWMTPERYAEMPETLTLRVVTVTVAEKGFRVERFHVATTLLDAERDPSDTLAWLYRKRWHVEIDLRAIKTHMALDILRGKTPHMMRLELFVGLLAYNLIRLKLLIAASQSDDITPRDVSFTSALTALSAGYTLILWMPPEHFAVWTHLQTRELPKHRVGHRPGRVEPRVVKRCPKPFPKMGQPRHELRRRLVDSTEIKNAGNL